MEATITTDGRKILAQIPYAGGAGPKAAKQVPGARADWDKSGPKDVFKGWVYPLSMDTCRAMRKVFGSGLTVLPPLVRWAHEQVAVERKVEDAREEVISSITFDLLVDQAPDLLAAMKNRPYQMSGASAVLAAKSFILGDDPGLGKTLQTLAALVESDAKVILVACRRTATRTVWERETMRWAPGIATFVAQGTRREREEVFAEFADFPVSIPGMRKMLIINIEMVRAKRLEICPETNGKCRFAPSDWRIPADHPKHRYEPEAMWPFLFTQDWDAIVVDEAHNLLASTKNIQSKAITQQRFGAMMLRRRIREGGIALALSGTPFRSNLTKAWGTLNWIRPDLFGSFWRFAGTHFGVEQGRYGKIIAGGARAPEPKDAEAWDRMLRPHYLKRTKAVAAPDLPPIMFAGTPIDGKDGENYVQLEMLPEQARLYRQMEADAEATMGGRKITATGTLPEITRLRQFANAAGTLGDERTVLPALPSNKLEWLVDFVQEREGTGVKVVVASSFTAIVELAARVLREECGVEVLTLTGATSDRARSDLVARFQDPSDPLRVVVINREAGGESITLDAADDMVVIDQPWISDKDEQLNSRIHRVSRIHQVTIYRLVSSGTIDEWMAGLTEEQREVVSKASPRKLSEMMKEAHERMAA